MWLLRNRFPISHQNVSKSKMSQGPKAWEGISEMNCPSSPCARNKLLWVRVSTRSPAQGAGSPLWHTTDVSSLRPLAWVLGCVIAAARLSFLFRWVPPGLGTWLAAAPEPTSACPCTAFGQRGEVLAFQSMHRIRHRRGRNERGCRWRWGREGQTFL